MMIDAANPQRLKREKKREKGKHPNPLKLFCAAGGR
jgi:hypothetical protein